MYILIHHNGHHRHPNSTHLSDKIGYRSTQNNKNDSNTFDVGDINVELRQFLTGSVHALVHGLQNLFRVLFHPAAERKLTRALLNKCS